MNPTSTALLLIATALPLTSNPHKAPARLKAMGAPRKPWAPNPTHTRIALAVALGLLTAVIAGLPLGPPLAAAVATTTWWLAGRTTRPRAPDPLALAAAWDLLAACLRAGLPVPTAVTAILDDLPAEAATALRSTADLLAMGADPVDAWLPAMRCPTTAPLARAARHTTRAGAALADMVDTQATTTRQSADDTAEAMAQRAGVLVAAPLGLCFLPAFICLGVAPVVTGLATHLTP